MRLMRTRPLSGLSSQPSSAARNFMCSQGGPVKPFSNVGPLAVGGVRVILAPSHSGGGPAVVRVAPVGLQGKGRRCRWSSLKALPPLQELQVVRIHVLLSRRACPWVATNPGVTPIEDTSIQRRPNGLRWPWGQQAFRPWSANWRPREQKEEEQDDPWRLSRGPWTKPAPLPLHAQW